MFSLNKWLKTTLSLKLDMGTTGYKTHKNLVPNKLVTQHLKLHTHIVYSATSKTGYETHRHVSL